MQEPNPTGNACLLWLWSDEKDLTGAAEITADNEALRWTNAAGETCLL